MCPTGRALHHPTAHILREWATLGCPTRMGRDWTKSEMWEAVERGPHRSAMSPDALEHFAGKAVLGIELDHLPEALCRAFKIQHVLEGASEPAVGVGILRISITLKKHRVQLNK